MGSSKEPNTKPQITMENRKSKVISILKSIFNSKKKDKHQVETPKPETQKLEKPNPVDSVLETFKALDLNNDKKSKKPEEPIKQLQAENKPTEALIKETKARNECEEPQNKISKPQNEKEETAKAESEEEDEFSDFAFKVVEEDRRSARVDSQSSEDSGFSDVKDDNILIESFQELCLEETGEKKKKLQTVLVSRGPDRLKLNDYSAHPYGKTQEDRTLINQVNKTALCGGNVTVNSTAPQTDSYVFDVALKDVEILSQISQNRSVDWADVMEIITADAQNQDLNTEIHNLKIQNTEIGTTEFSAQTRNIEFSTDIQQLPDISTLNPEFQPPQNPLEIPVFSSSDYQSPIEEFNSHLENPNFSTLPDYEESVDLTSIINLDYPETTSTKYDILDPTTTLSSIFPTPPRSENVPSPMSESQTFYPSNCQSEYTLSPERSSPYSPDFERYQEIIQPDLEKPEKKERKNSISNLTLKNFKDMQKELGNGFSKMDCCVLNRKSCKDIFDGYMSKLKTVERKNLCIRISKLDMKTCYGVLQNILINLSRGDSTEEPLQMALFTLICQKVVMQAPALFVGDFGLNVLKSSALRCPHLPHLTRIVVDCVYRAILADPTLCTKDHVFHEVDGQGDNLVIACARAGDRYALVLAEITRNDERRNLPPLFRLEHVNSDGHTALHVACSQHSSTSPRLHTVHVLLDHSGADLWKGDVKGGDTALHLAVNSSSCDLKVVLMLFRHIDRKMWKKLAHAQNMSSVTPLEYARSATRSTTRQDYPQEVLNFLMKCR